MKKKLILLTAAILSIIIGMVCFAACNNTKGFDENKNISVVTREDGSGTKSAFMEMLGLKGQADVSGVIIANGTAGVLAEVKNNPHAIAFESLGYVTDEVKMLKIDGVEATVANIKYGKYGIARPLSVVYKESNVASGVNAAFIEYLASSDAQEIISAEGYVSTKDNAAAYVVKSNLSGEINISGSTSLKPLMLKLAMQFENKQSGITVTVGAGGSGQGYNDAEKNVSDFGMISEEFNSSKAPSCVSYEVAKDGIAMIVNKSNTFDNITLAELKNIYDCNANDNAITKWSQISK